MEDVFSKIRFCNYFQSEFDYEWLKNSIEKKKKRKKRMLANFYWSENKGLKRFFRNYSKYKKHKLKN
jgi:hypothetical protein